MICKLCGKPRTEVKTEGGQVFAYRCGCGLAPVQDPPPRGRPCPTCGCKSGHAIGCAGGRAR